MGTKTRSRSWLFTTLLVLGALIEACSNQSGSNGPSFPSGQTGGTDLAPLVTTAARHGPGEDQFVITVLVQSGARGRPVEGVAVTLLLQVTGSPTGTPGSLSPTSGITDHNGSFTSVLTCGDGPTTVMVLTEGASDSVGPLCGEPAGAAPVGATPAGGTGTPPPTS